MGYLTYQNAGSYRITDAPTVVGAITQPATGSIKIKREQFGGFNRTVLTLDNVPQAIVDGVEYQSNKIYTFPEGRILVLGVTATIQQKTTSALATTLNASSTGAASLGTAAASAVTLATTMADLLPSLAFTSSATVKRAPATITTRCLSLAANRPAYSATTSRAKNWSSKPRSPAGWNVKITRPPKS